jgi:hypothetical protein
MRALLWTGTDVIQNGKALAAWSRAQRPLHLGGLGVKDMHLLGIALRARWLWLQRTDLGRAWASLPCSVDSTTQAFFEASVLLEPHSVSGLTLGYEERAWLTSLQTAVPPSIRKRRTVSTALADHAWIRDVTGALTVA